MVMIYIWLGVIFALIMIEIISKNYTAICFAISALFSLISVNNTTENYIIQVVIFLVGGILLMVFIRPNAINMIEEYKKKKNKNNDKIDEKETKNEAKNDKKIEKPSSSKKNTKKTSNKSKKVKKKNANK
jgi:membrane protein implicated in regulation of membrane protease activity